MESGIARALESTPKEVLQNFLGVNYLLRGSNSPDPPPRQIQPCSVGVGVWLLNVCTPALITISMQSLVSLEIQEREAKTVVPMEDENLPAESKEKASPPSDWVWGKLSCRS